jgi:threonine dehydratase
VGEQDLERAIVGLVDAEHLIAEGAGAAATAALIARRIDARGKDVATLLTGANIDRRRLASLLVSR